MVGRTGAPHLDAYIDQTYQETNFDTTLRSAAVFLEEYSREHFVAPSIINHLYVLLDDKDKQLEWMMKMFDASDPNLPYKAIKTGDSIQEDPTYKLIMNELGLW